MQTQARYLVTGGAGFIGSHLVGRLVQTGNFVRVLDNLSTGNAENLTAFEGGFEFLEGDITDPEAVRSAVEATDYVLHQAALPSVPRSLADPLATDHNNVRGTLQVLLASRAAGVKRVVQASSSSVYGDTPRLPKIETMPLAPRSPYATSKAAGELYGLAFHRSFGLEYVGLRYFNVFGPRQDPRSQYAAVIPRFVTAALEGRSPTVYGDGTQSRDFCFIDNVVDANLLACTAPNAPGRVLNIACGERIDLLSVLGLLADELDTKIEPELDADRAGDVKHSLADIDAAREVLGYEAKVRFAEGFRRTIDWYRKAAAGERVG